ncbi:MAG: RNA polymerase sigma factor [Syntrophomonadaceae bacterium]|jgi:RNA polymerase sigma-70 factor (ECF subfamily)|nr:RNA polymerase sigma factor [Syntrophomonadaceae bacterium]
MKYDAAGLENEKKLVEQAKHDPAAFGRLYEQNYDSILNYALRRTGDIQVAQDITAETFLKALKDIGKFKWQNVPFSAWLFKIATNEIAAWFRKGSYKSVSLEKLRDEGFEPISGDDVEQEAIAAQEEILRSQEFLAVRKKIDLLPQKYQEVIALRFFAGKQIAEIGQILDKPEGTIKSLLHRGLERLKKEFQSEKKMQLLS